MKKIAAQLDLSELPKGYGFKFKVRLKDTTENDSKPILDRVTLKFNWSIMESCKNLWKEQ